MLPSELQAEQFSSYPPQARALAVAHLATLRALPLSLLPSMLRELIDYDFKFPAERASIDHELALLTSLSAQDKEDWLREFRSIQLGSDLQKFDWVNEPAQFVEQQSAYLWSTHQLDAFRKAATEYGTRLQRSTEVKPLPLPRLGIAVIGKGVETYDGRLFRNLQAHGTRFTHINPQNGLQQLIATVEERAAAAPAPYAHWYVDGGHLEKVPAGVVSISYEGMAPMRTAMLSFMQKEIQTPGMGPERLRTDMAMLTPARLGVESSGDPVLDRFQVRILTEGSGTQIFSTTYAQWSTREALRRAEPLTMLVRYAPRQRQRPMNELLSDRNKEVALDAPGSLVDGDMGAYYHWINQQRLAGYEKSAFIAWFEEHGEAVAIAPALEKGSVSPAPLDLSSLVKLALRKG